MYKKQINKIYYDFSGKMSGFQLFQRVVQKTSEKELIAFHEYSESLANNPKQKVISQSLDNMYFHCARSGRLKIFDQKKSSVEDRKLAVIMHQNKQYQWLLAEAYECFEDYLESMYACAGFADKSLWPLCDFGNISINELNNQDFNFFLEQSRKKRDVPRSILRQFRNVFPELKELEIKNKLKINLHLALTFIELLRHIIVHKNGWVSDKDEFTEKVIQKVGLFNNGRYKSAHANFIKSYFGDKKYKNMILLLEIRDDDQSGAYLSPFNNLFGYLMSYSFLIYEFLLEYIE